MTTIFQTRGYKNWLGYRADDLRPNNGAGHGR